MFKELSFSYYADLQKILFTCNTLDFLNTFDYKTQFILPKTDDFLYCQIFL